MKPEIFQIRFENPRNVVYAGEDVRGDVVLKLREPMKMKSTDSVEHPAGEHRYPFSFTLGTNHPSSFRDEFGYVRYFCRVTIRRSWSFDVHIAQAFTVVHHLDLNLVPNVAMPISKIYKDNVKTFFSTAGFVSARLKLNKTGFFPGEPFQYDISLVNNSKKEVKKIELVLRQDMTYTAMLKTCNGRSPIKYEKVVTFGIMSQPCCIKPNLGRQISKEATIPVVTPTGLHGCSIIDIEYKLVVKVHVGFTTLLFVCRIVIGTIPLQASTSSSEAFTFLPQSASQAGLPNAPIASEPGVSGALSSSQPSLSSAYGRAPSAPPPRSCESQSEPPPTYEEAVANMVPFLEDKHTGQQTLFTVPIERPNNHGFHAVNCDNFLDLDWQEMPNEPICV